MGDDVKESVFEIPLAWDVPPDIVSRYATTVVIQHTEHEFFISFFETVPPIMLLAKPEALEEALKEIDSIRSTCVARLVMAAERIPAFIDALQKNYEKYTSRQTEREEAS